MLLPGKSAIAFLTLGVLATLGGIRAADLSWRRGATALVGLMVGSAAAGSPGSGASAQ